MARLFVRGSDDGVWGDLLNRFLAVEHNADGTLIRGSLAHPGALAPLSYEHASYEPEPYTWLAHGKRILHGTYPGKARDGVSGYAMTMSRLR